MSPPAAEPTAGAGAGVAYGMQSPAQARDLWGTNGAAAMDDATTVSVILRSTRPGGQELGESQDSCPLGAIGLASL